MGMSIKRAINLFDSIEGNPFRRVEPALRDEIADTLRKAGVLEPGERGIEVEKWYYFKKAHGIVGTYWRAHFEPVAVAVDKILENNKKLGDMFKGVKISEL